MLGRLLGEVFLKALPSFLVHTCPSGAEGPELSDRKGHGLHFFFPLKVPKIGFRREVSKTVVKKRRLFPSPSWVRPSQGGRGWRVEGPGESSEIEYGLAPPGLCGVEAT